jgi:hypothetical protein
MQIVHLLLADALWVMLVLFALAAAQSQAAGAVTEGAQMRLSESPRLS